MQPDKEQGKPVIKKAENNGCTKPKDVQLQEYMYKLASDPI